MMSRIQFYEANNARTVDRLGRGLLQFMHLQIVKLLQRVENMYIERLTNRNQYMNTCVISATSYPSLSQYYTLALKSLSKNVHPYFPYF